MPLLRVVIRRATTSIEIVQLFFDADFKSEFGSGATSTLLVDELARADARGVKVRILLDKIILSFGVSSTDTLIAAFRARGANVVRDFPIWEPGRLHSKAMVVDGKTAYVMGATLQQEMFDTKDHPVEDLSLHRGGKEPLHTESAKISGPAVADIEKFFAEFWNHADTKYFGGHDQIPTPVAPPASGSHTVQVVRTIPPAIGVGPPTGEIEILEAYQRAFANAHRFIYVEHQYLLFRPILEAIRVAMDRNPSLQVIAVLNENPDQDEFMYREWQARAISQVLGPPGPQLGLFSLWTVSPAAAGKTAIRRIYVEGKLAVVDDTWMTLGTANLDGLSMAAFETADNLAPPALLLPFQGMLDTKRHAELNVVVFDGISGAARSGIVREARCEAWSEHLALPPTQCAATPDGTWLSLWNSTAQANVTNLKRPSPTLKGYVLPWVPGGLLEAASQLNALGIPLSNLDVRQDRD